LDDNSNKNERNVNYFLISIFFLKKFKNESNKLYIKVFVHTKRQKIKLIRRKHLRFIKETKKQNTIQKLYFSIAIKKSIPDNILLNKKQKKFKINNLFLFYCS
jgi:hypothetical protein